MPDMPQQVDKKSVNELLAMIEAIKSVIPGHAVIGATETFQGVSLNDLENAIKADVAQPAEQGFRKAEVAGSTPVISSKGMNEMQREKMRHAVHVRVQLEEARARRNKAQKDLKDLETEYKKKKAELESSIEVESTNVQHYTEMVLESEEALKKVIADGLAEEQRAAESDAIKEKQAFLDDGDLGRID